MQVGLCGSDSYNSVYPVTIPGAITYEDFNGDSLRTATVSSATLRAPLIQINWQSSDLIQIATKTTQPTESESVSLIASTSTFIPQSSSLLASTSALPLQSSSPQSFDLSTGDKIVLGVALPLVIIGMAGLVAVLLLWKRGWAEQMIELTYRGRK